MGVGEIGALASGLSAVLLVVLSVVAWVVRRQSKEAKEARRLKETNLAALRWYYKVSALAAIRGWDSDAAWPAIPREMTAEYLLDQAQDDPAGPIAELAQAAQEIRKDQAK